MTSMVVFFISLLACVAVIVGEDSFYLESCAAQGGVCAGNGTCAKARICTCNAGYAPTGQACVSSTFKPDDRYDQAYTYNYINGTCKEFNFLDKCFDLYGECAGTADNPHCRCPPGYFKDHVCVRSSFNTTQCSTPGTSCSSSNGVCGDGTCVCKEGYFAANAKCVTSRFTPQGRCTEGEVCGALKGRCKQGVCQCEPFHFVENDYCISDSVTNGNTCVYPEDVAKPCNDGSGTCGKLRCICNVGFVAGANRCEARSFKPQGGCIISAECSDAHGVCVEGDLCKCKGTSYVREGRCVNDSYVNEECGTGEPLCSKDMGLCQDNIVCHCLKGNWAWKGSCVSDSFLEKDCIRAGQLCSYNLGVCVAASICKCNSGKYVTGNVGAINCSDKVPGLGPSPVSSTVTPVPKMRILFASFTAVIIAVILL